MYILFLLVLLSTSTFGGIYTRKIWGNNNVSVCFAQAEPELRRVSHDHFRIIGWTEKKMKKAASFINAEYTPERTAIHFTGWRPCQEMPYADVIFFLAEDTRYSVTGFNGLGSIGPQPGVVSGYPYASGMVVITRDFLYKSLTVHEFGHVAGLHHEHEHPDFSRFQKNCWMQAAQNFSPSNVYFTEFDHKSVMNYCTINAPGGRGLGLSKGDVSLLNYMYQ